MKFHHALQTIFDASEQALFQLIPEQQSAIDTGEMKLKVKTSLRMKR